MRHATPASRTLTYAQAQALAVATGAVILGALALVMYLRRVETVEVVAVLLFFPVFLAALRWDVAGGATAAAAASVAYVGLRWSAIHAVGFGSFTGLVGSRVLGLFVFGVAGGWANGALRASLTKLDLYDQVDDATSLFNARFFVHQIDLEAARVARYHTFFAVVAIDLWLAPLGGRAERRLLRDLGRLLSDSVRTVDCAVHAVIGSSHRVAVVLPETGGPGAAIFGERLAVQLGGWLTDRRVATTRPLEPVTAALPGDEALLAVLREEFAAADRIEHPMVAQS